MAGGIQIVPSGVFGREGRPGANARLVVAHIGVGGMGMTHVNNMLRFQKEDKVRIAAVCDADDNRLSAAFENVGGAPAVKAYRDYRYIIERKDIDAVLIATPDHWHAVQTVHACQSVCWNRFKRTSWATSSIIESSIESAIRKLDI